MDTPPGQKDEQYNTCIYNITATKYNNTLHNYTNIIIIIIILSTLKLSTGKHTSAIQYYVIT